ncbi:MAG TPA: hypothetical protein VKR52_13490 [Terracidiphilus sp.]|nr:hypothetical protein [Terracidiphilus sp.]
MTKNITIAIDADIYRRARVWAAQRGTSISHVVSFILSDLPLLPRAQEAFPVIIPDSQLIPPRPESVENWSSHGAHKSHCETAKPPRTQTASYQIARAIRQQIAKL